jgi:hypothetical protein
VLIDATAGEIPDALLEVERPWFIVTPADAIELAELAQVRDEWIARRDAWSAGRCGPPPSVLIDAAARSVRFFH